jgi:hypothetical protein
LTKEESTPTAVVAVAWASVVRWLALAAAALIGFRLALSLDWSPTPGSVKSRQIMRGGVLLSMIGLFVTNKRAKLALVVSGVILATAGFVVHLP